MLQLNIFGLTERSGSASAAATGSMQWQEAEMQSFVKESLEGHSVLQIYK